MTIWRKYEPTLGELLADSGTRALMHADGVKRSEVEVLFKRIGRNSQYAVISEVVSGVDAVDKIKKGEPATDPDRIIRTQVAADAK